MGPKKISFYELPFKLTSSNNFDKGVLFDIKEDTVPDLLILIHEEPKS